MTSTSPTRPTGRGRVEAALNQHFGDGPIPRGKLAEIARETGVSREYVRQVVVAAGREYAEPANRACSVCGRRLSRGQARFCSKACQSVRSSVARVCQRCGTAFDRRERIPRGEAKKKAQRFCSKECWYQQKHLSSRAKLELHRAAIETWLLRQGKKPWYVIRHLRADGVRVSLPTLRRYASEEGFLPPSNAASCDDAPSR
ncbi:MAG: hypothetical protein AB7T37_18385 [Dehalococcoidia bacterium]